MFKFGTDEISPRVSMMGLGLALLYIEFLGVRFPVFGPEPVGVCAPLLVLERSLAVKGRDFGGEVNE